MTFTQALRLAVPRLKQAGIDDPAKDARLLLAHATGIAPDRLTLHLHDPLSSAAADRFDAALTAREARQPLSQITGQRLFWGRAFRVTPDVLDPRPETEILVAAALDRPFAKILDLGTGSGCILLSCLLDRPQAQGSGVDISAPALAIARENAARLGAENATFLQSDWCKNVRGHYDLILSNPPYIAAAEMPGLAPEVRLWEPRQALTPGGDGLDAYRIIARDAPARLLPAGRLLVEIGPTQADAVAALLAAQGLIRIVTLPDLDGRDRVIQAEKPH